MDLGIVSDTLSGDITVLAVTGEVDVYTAPQLRHAAVQALADGARRMIVDLNGVDFLDSTGLGVLVGMLKRLRAVDGALALVCRQARILKIFRITGLTRVFDIFPEVAAAAASLAGESPDAVPLASDPDEIGWHWVPARIYLSEGRDHQAVEDALIGVVEAFGLELVDAEAPEAGSWFRRFLIRLKNSGQLPTAEEQFVKLGRALDLELLHRKQAEVDAAQGAAVAGLITALGATPRAVVQIGSVLLVKDGDTVVVRNLTQLEIAHWERNPALFCEPAAALRELQRAAAGEIEPGPAAGAQAITR